MIFEIDKKQVFASTAGKDFDPTKKTVFLLHGSGLSHIVWSLTEQFLSNKDSLQEEFFHTFEELHKNKKQIVLTADKIPKQIAGLEDRLKSRFQWGQVVDVQAPELETKIAIIKKKCEIDQIHLDDDIVKFALKIARDMGIIYHQQLFKYKEYENWNQIQM